MTREEYNVLTKEIIDASIEVHKVLGPGLLEQAYKVALLRELSIRGIKAEKEQDIPFFYKGETLSSAYRADIIVEGEVIIELKATEKDNSLYPKQLNSYLKLANKKVGLLINFNRERLIDGLTRVVNNF